MSAKFEPGTQVVYQGARGTFAGRVSEVEQTTDFGTVNPITAYYVTDPTGEIEATGEKTLTEVRDSADTSVNVHAIGTMRPTDDGWVLELDFEGSVEGGVLCGIVVDAHPQQGEASNALQAWLGSVGAEGSVLTLDVRPPRRQRFTKDEVRSEVMNQIPTDYSPSQIDQIVDVVLAGSHPNLAQSVARAISGLDA